MVYEMTEKVYMITEKLNREEMYHLLAGDMGEMDEM